MDTFYKRSLPFVGILVIGLLFALASYLSYTYEEHLRLLLGKEQALGEVVYVVVTALAIVVAPVSTLPLMPLATHLWGWFPTALLSITGWVIGSQIAFLLARRFGKPLILHFVSLENIERVEHSFPARNLFYTVVMLRMMLPVDILSYALGLFTTMSSRNFFFSTVLGVSPFAFIFAYTGGLSLKMQLLIISELGILFALIAILKKWVTKKDLP